MINLIINDKRASFENLQIFLKNIIFVAFSVLNVPSEAQHGVDGLVDLEKEDMVQNCSENYVTCEIINEHVVCYGDLVLSAHEIENGYDWHRVVHTKGDGREKGPCLRAEYEPEGLSFTR